MSNNKSQMGEKTQNLNFFSRRRIIVLTLFFLITIALIVVTLIDILKINISQTFQMMSDSIKTNGLGLFIIFLLILLVFPLVKLFVNVCYYHFIFKKMNIKIRKRDWFSISLIAFFVTCITPSSLGNEPFWIYWLNKRVFNVKKASAVVLANTMLMQLAGVTITLPFFIYFCTQYNLITSSESGFIVFWFSIVGVSIDYLVLLGLIVIIYSKKTHYYFAICFHKIKKFLGLKYKTKEVVISETLTEKVFKKEVIAVLKNYCLSLIGFLLFFIYNAFLYMCMGIAMVLVTDLKNVDFFQVFTYVNVGITANNFVPLPGSEGSLQLILQIMLRNTLNSGDIVNNGIFVWRFFTNWMGAFLGIIVIFGKTVKVIQNYKNRKINNNLNSKNGVLFIYDENNFLMNSDKLKYYTVMFKKNLYGRNIFILDFKKISKNFKNIDKKLFAKRGKILAITQKFNPINANFTHYLKFLKWKRRLIKINTKIVKKFLLTKNFNSIIDFSYFGLGILSGHKEYYWIQNKSYDEIQGSIFKTKTKNFFSVLFKKYVFSFDPFYSINNVLVTETGDKNIGNNNHFIFINEMNETTLKAYFSKIENVFN